MPTDKPDKQADETPESSIRPKKPVEASKLPESTEPAKTAEPTDASSLSGMEASFWDESQIKEVMRHAGATGKSPEEFFNKKWKDRLIHGKKEEHPRPSDRGDAS